MIFLTTAYELKLILKIVVSDLFEPTWGVLLKVYDNSFLVSFSILLKLLSFKEVVEFFFPDFLFYLGNWKLLFSILLIKFNNFYFLFFVDDSPSLSIFLFSLLFLVSHKFLIVFNVILYKYRCLLELCCYAIIFKFCFSLHHYYF